MGVEGTNMKTKCDLCAEKLSAEALQAENERLRAALEWYANRRNYSFSRPGAWRALDFYCDDGQRARKALEGKR